MFAAKNTQISIVFSSGSAHSADQGGISPEIQHEKNDRESAALAAAAVAAVPVIGWLLALLFMLFGAGIGGGIAGGAWGGADEGSTSDLDPTIGELHINEVLVSYGTWAYDSGHNADLNAGWNELHPVNFLAKANACVDSDGAAAWEDKIIEALNIPDYRGAAEKHPLVGSAYHPLIDGCSAREHDEPPVIN